MERFYVEQVLKTGATKSMFVLQGSACCGLFGYAWWITQEKELGALGFLVAGAAFLCSITFCGSRYEMTESTILFRTSITPHWVEWIDDISRVVPCEGRGPFGHSVPGFKLELPRKFRFVAPADPDEFLRQLKLRRPDLRNWGFELRAPILDLPESQLPAGRLI
jgi:hypothetical protein